MGSAFFAPGPGSEPGGKKLVLVPILVKKRFDPVPLKKIGPGPDPNQKKILDPVPLKQICPDPDPGQKKD